MTGGRSTRILLLAGAITIGLLAAAANAAAVVRYASPAGSGSACTNVATPCAINVAINSAGMNDEVVLLGGVPPAAPYVTSTPLTGTNGVDIHGAPGARPVIQSTAAGDAVTVNSGGSIADAVIEYTGNFTALLANGAEVDRVSAHGDGLTACGAVNNAFIADSVCRYTGSSAFGAGLTAEPAGSNGNVMVRNVTAVASTGPGILAQTLNSFSISLVAVNTIADGNPNDIYAARSNTGLPSVGMVNSNFATAGADAGGNVTAPGSSANQTAAPVFADAAAEDFHQLSTSTGTVDRGTDFISLGSFDFEGQARVQGPAPDIGADEGALPRTGGPAPLPAPPFNLKAALKKCKKIKSQAKRKKCTKRAKARAGA